MKPTILRQKPREVSASVQPSEVQQAVKLAAEAEQTLYEASRRREGNLLRVLLSKGFCGF